jgi:hypothetical protein
MKLAQWATFYVNYNVIQASKALMPNPYDAGLELIDERFRDHWPRRTVIP